MASRYSIILSFLLATLLAAGSVELLYRSLDNVLTAGKTGPEELKQLVAPKGKETLEKKAKQTGQVVSGEEYTIISKRNLFGKAPETTNKPVRTPKAILSTTSLDLMLLGTIGGMSDDQRAIIRNKKSNKQAIYSKGDAIENALIKEINRAQIILTVNGRDEVLLMEVMKSPPSSGKTKNYPMPEVTSPANSDVADDEPTESTELIETAEPLPPAAIPKRRLTLKPKKTTGS